MMQQSQSIFQILQRTMTDNQKFIDNDNSSTDDSEGSVFFSLIEKVGAMGRYQVITFALWAALSILTGGLMLMTPFLFFQDPYDCQDSPSGSSCLDYVCSLSISNRWSYVPRPSMISLVNKFGDFRCASEQSQINSIITLMYGGVLCGILLLSLLGGRMGRKKLMLLNMCLGVIGIFLTALSVNVLMGGVGMFMALFGLKNSHNLCFIFIAETVQQEYRHRFSIGIQTCFSIGSILNIFWFYIIGNFETILIFCYGLPGLIITGFIIFFVRDTPISLITKVSAKKAFKDLEHIAKTNRLEDYDLTVQDVHQIQQNYKDSVLTQSSSEEGKQKIKTFSIADLFRYPSLRKLTVLLVILDLTVALEYYTPTLMLDQFHFNIFINGLVVQSAIFLACLPTFFLIGKLGRRTMSWVSFSIILICSVILVFIWNQNSDQVSDIRSNIVILVLIFALEFSITSEFNFFFIYINELYPTQVRIIGFGFIEIFGALVLCTSKWIISFCLKNGFKIMILFALLAAISIVCSYLLPETLGKKPVETIEELEGAEIDNIKGEREKEVCERYAKLDS